MEAYLSPHCPFSIPYGILQHPHQANTPLPPFCVHGSPLPHHRDASPVFVIPAETLKVHSGCSSKPSAWEVGERERERWWSEGGGLSKGEKGESQGGKLLPPVQMLVKLICSISTITSPASRLIIISVVFTYTEEQGPKLEWLWGEKYTQRAEWKKTEK